MFFGGGGRGGFPFGDFGKWIFLDNAIKVQTAHSSSSSVLRSKSSSD